MTKNLLQKTGNNNLLTPESVLDIIRPIVGGQIPLDPCTASWNPTEARRFYDGAAHGDGLLLPWEPGTYWNPPFGRSENSRTSQCYAWAAKARQEAMVGNWSIALLPCDTGRQSTQGWQEHVFCREMAIYCVLNKRTNFDVDVDGRRFSHASASPTYSTGLYLYLVASQANHEEICRRFYDACLGHGAIMGPRLDDCNSQRAISQLMTNASPIGVGCNTSVWRKYI